MRGTAGTGGTGSSCRVGGDAGRFSGDFEVLKNAVPFAIDWFTVIWETRYIFRVAVGGREMRSLLQWSDLQ